MLSKILKKKVLFGIPFWLIILLIISFSIKIYRLDERTFWEDEALNAYAAQQSVKNLVRIPTYPYSKEVITGISPLVYGTMGFLQIIFGAKEFVYRLLSVFSGTLAILPIYKIGELLFDEKTAFFSVLLLSFSSEFIIISREALPLATGIFFLVIFIYIFLRAMENPKSKTFYYLSFVFGILALFSHFLNSLLLLFLPLVIFIRSRKKFWEKFRYVRFPYFTMWLTFLSLFFWFTLNSAHPLLENPAYKAYKIKGIVGILKNPVPLLTTLKIPFDLLSRVNLWGFFTSLKHMLSNYLSPSYGHIISILLIFFVYSCFRKEKSNLVLVAWLISFITILFPIFLVFSAINWQIFRSHFFFIPIIFLMIGKSLSDISKKTLFGAIILTAVLLGIYILKLPLILTKSLITNAGGITLTTVESIVCSGMFCFEKHPVGYDDSINWKAAIEAVEKRISKNDRLFISHPAPFAFYSTQKTIIPVDLHCNVNHYGCNLMLELLNYKNGRIFLLVDKERYGWQLNWFEKRYVEKNCKLEELYNLLFYTCQPAF